MQEQLNAQINKFKDYSELWPLITFSTLLVGYIGFYSYSAMNHIPYVNPDISIIAGIGVYNFIFIGLIWLHSNDKLPHPIVMFNVYAVMNMITNPIALAVMLILFLHFFAKEKKSEENEESKLSFAQKVISSSLFKLVLYVSVMLIGMFINENFSTVALTIYAYCVAMNQIRRKVKSNLISYFIIIVATPCFLSFSFLSRSQITPFGLSREYVEILRSDKAPFHGRLLFKDDKFLYLINENNDSTFVILTDKIEQMNVQTKPMKIKGWLYSPDWSSVEFWQTKEIKKDTLLKYDTIK